MINFKRISSGKDKDFYSRMGPFFASRAVRRDLDGYPLSNEDDWTWIIAEHKKEIIGFVALEPVKGGISIDAVYVAPGYPKYELMDDMLFNVGTEQTVTVTTRKELMPVYEKAGFVVTGTKGKNWLVMRREADAKAV